jgi:hypothetical protein
MRALAPLFVRLLAAVVELERPVVVLSLEIFDITRVGRGERRGVTIIQKSYDFDVRISRSGPSLAFQHEDFF